MTEPSVCSCQLAHHGAAAASHGKVLAWLCDDTLVYASHAMVHLAERRTVVLAGAITESVWNVRQTLRTRLLDSLNETTVLSSLCSVQSVASMPFIGIACGFTNGSLNLWRKRGDEWTEFVLLESSGDNGRSVTDIDCIAVAPDEVWVLTGSSLGATLHHCRLLEEGSVQVLTSQSLLESSVCTVQLQNFTPASSSSTILALIGTAAARHNKIHVSTVDASSTKHYYHGSLSGHEDWITGLAWRDGRLASSSQDAKIRLWKFVLTSTNTAAASPTVSAASNESQQPALQDTESDDDDLRSDLEEEEGGESRLEILHNDTTSTSVLLEALLIGHEAAVTSVCWHPDPRPYYGTDLLLVSSSMDRTILLWMPGDNDIWTPVSRVGSAGGILGGSVGSSLLGFLDVTMDATGRSLVGHAHGGALNVWSLEETSQKQNAETTDEPSTLVQWRAMPCLTGHFDGVTDLCWEATTGEYLLTVSLDQTCRLWAPVRTDTGDLWVELARPQVHGYDLSAVVSLSSPRHPHLLVTGADEKELRVFDAPKTTIRALSAACGVEPADDPIDRQERAYIPSLGLSNKASANEGAEEDKDGDDGNDADAESDKPFRLPLERDLGAVSLWPEIRKLYGHNTEIYSLASTLCAHTSGSLCQPSSDAFLQDVLVASSAKARDVESASIRLWNVEQGRCVQVLTGGHKSTVASMSFSPNGKYLATAGKDRRLCIWRRDEVSKEFALAFAKDAAHKRIIWSVQFCPFDDSILASGSRDGCVKLWRVKEMDDGVEAKVLVSFAPSYHHDAKPDAVTALSFAPVPFSPGVAVLALGLESGRIELWKVNDPELLLQLSDQQCHIARITKLAWKPLSETSEDDDSIDGRKELMLASSSLDHGCRIFNVSW